MLKALNTSFIECPTRTTYPTISIVMMTRNFPKNRHYTIFDDFIYQNQTGHWGIKTSHNYIGYTFLLFDRLCEFLLWCRWKNQTNDLPLSTYASFTASHVFNIMQWLSKKLILIIGASYILDWSSTHLCKHFLSICSMLPNMSERGGPGSATIDAL